MKTLVAAFITALLVFILATGWMEVVQPRLELMEMATASKAKERVVNSTTKSHSRRTELVAAEDEEEIDLATIETAAKAAMRASRAAKQSRESSAVSERTKIRLSAQLAEVKQQESKLVAREETLRMLYDDIRSELAAVEDIRQRSANELALAERRLLEAPQIKTHIDSLTNEREGSKPSIAKTGKAGEAYIAGLVQELANRGSIETAAGLLRGMKDRDVAKVLGSLSLRDRALADRLSAQLLSAKQNTTIRR